MDKNKIISAIVILLFFIVMSLFFAKDYLNFHKQKYEIKKINQQSIELTKNFQIKELKEVSNIEFYYSPSTKLKEKIIDNIDNAEKYIYLEMYMFTEKNIKNAIIRAYNRGVNIKIILEKHPYMAGSINDKFYQELKKKGINIVRSNNKNYVLNHSKLMIIDGVSMISTGNFSYSTFKNNRDLFLFIDNQKINNSLIQIFENDFSGTAKTFYNENLIVSPIYSREKIEKLILFSKKDIKLYMQYFNDDNIRNLLIKLKKNNNINISTIIPESAKDDIETNELIENGIEVRVLSKYKMHAKAILIDEEILFIGSLNFSDYSFDKNREIGILIKNKVLISQFIELFNEDFNN